MTLIKLSEDHYILTDDSDISIGNIVAEKLLTGKYELFTIHTLNDIDKSSQKKITYSTQPESLGMGWMQSVQPLFLSEVKELLGIVDVEKKALEISPVELDEDEFDVNETHRVTWIDGYNQALEDNKERKYTNKDIVTAIAFGFSICRKENRAPFDIEQIQFIQSLQPTEWEVEMVDGKLKLKS